MTGVGGDPREGRMKAYSLISGRGNYVGYGFTAVSPQIPYSAPWMSGHRASDTFSQQPILEMHCAGFGKPVFIASRWVVDGRPFGYTEYLAVPPPEEHALRKAFLSEPGRMLYHAFTGKDEFLELDTPGGSGQARLPVGEVPLPPLPRDAAPEMPEDMLASLLADAWANSFMRLIGGDYTPVRVSLSTPEERDSALQQGLAFLNRVLLPHLPEPVRHIVSVSVGSHWKSIPRAAGSSTPAVAFTLPDGEPFSMPGGYDLVSRQFTPMHNAGWAELGMALIRKQGLEDYEAWIEILPEHPLLADFEAAWYLYSIRRVLRQPHTRAELEAAIRSHQKLENLLNRKYQGIPRGTRRLLLLGTEADLARAYKGLVGHQTLLPRGFQKLLVERLFTLGEELAQEGRGEQASALRADYQAILAAPETADEGYQEPPVFGLLTISDLQSTALSKDRDLYLEMIRLALGHAAKQPVNEKQWAALEDLFKNKLQGAHQAKLAGILADYTLAGLENGFPVKSARNVHRLLNRHPEQVKEFPEAVVRRFAAGLPDSLTNTEQLKQAVQYRNYIKEQQDEQGGQTLTRGFYDAVHRFIAQRPDEGAISLNQLIEASNDMNFGWVNYPELMADACRLLETRGTAAPARLEEGEASKLGELARKHGGDAPLRLKAALDPLASGTQDENTMKSLKILLPTVFRAPPSQAPESLWMAAWRGMVFESLGKCLEPGAAKVDSLLKPQKAWEENCPIKSPALDSFDQLEQWHIPAAELERFSYPLLYKALQASSLEALSRHLPGWKPGGGWFSRLLDGILQNKLLDEKFQYFRNQGHSMPDIQSMWSLLNAYNGNHKWDTALEALRFVLDGHDGDIRGTLGRFAGLRQRDLAGFLLGNLLAQSAWEDGQAVDASAGKWDARVVDVRLAMAAMASIRKGEPPQPAIPEFLKLLRLDSQTLEKANPWDNKEGTRAFSFVLNLFRWLESMGFHQAAEELGSLLSSWRFTRQARNRQKNRMVFSPAIRGGKSPADEGFSPAIRAWLDLK